jgi:L-asparaginase
MNIHIVHTGGTIGSAAENGVTDVRRASEPSASPLFIPEGVDFSESRPMNILSENMTLARWCELIFHLRTLPLNGKDGLIVTHGTDTLAYTACMLSLFFSAPPGPVLLVSANRPLSDPASNGPANFAAAIAAIHEKIPPGVYAVYTNSDGRTYIHAGAELLQCPVGSNDFFSLFCGGAAGEPLAEIKGAHIRYFKAPASRFTMRFGNRAVPIAGDDFAKNLGGDFASVLSILPYVGLHYGRYALDGVDAVLHGLYHSYTAAALTEAKDAGASILRFAKRCADAGVPLYIAPFPDSRSESGEAMYETTARILDAGAIPVYGATFEMALTALTLGLAPLSRPSPRRS